MRGGRLLSAIAERRPGAASWVAAAALVVGLLGAVSARGDDADNAEETQPAPRPRVVVVVGAPGTDEYKLQFLAWAERWRAAAKMGGADFTQIGGVLDGVAEAEPEADNDRTRLEQLLAEHATHADAEPLWLVLIGHGSFDGEAAKFNLRGPDATAEELAAWLAPIKTPLAVIDFTSASAPLIMAASAPNRVVITATKSGYELNYARFGQYLAEAINDAAADLDKDDQTSLLEAFLTACRGVEEFYSSDQRLATEHALLDDNGDGLGTPADWYRGVRATQRAKEGASLDGQRAHQWHLVRSDRESQMPRDVRERRDALELSLAALRDEKAKLGDEAYYEKLEPLLVELAQLYGSVGDADAAR
jgi:hypothetical protein